MGKKKLTIVNPERPFKPPEEVDILSAGWETHYSKGLDGKLEGEIDSEKRAIRVHADTPVHARGDVWFHELGHAIAYSSGFNNAVKLAMQAAGMDSAQANVLVDGIDELVQEVFGRALYDTLRRNKINFG
jgi:hypothetical protein